MVADSERLHEQLKNLQTRTKDPMLRGILKRMKSEDVPLDEVNNCLMANFRDHSLVDAYSLLYELNHKQFILIIFNKIKYYCHLLDPKDILQDVFLSIYRYPSKFREDKPHAFRNWSYSIIRNTILKHLKMRDGQEISTDTLIDIMEDKKQDRPLNNLVKRESLKKFKKSCMLYLILYLNIVNNYLSERERLALHLVEVEDKRYREASKSLGIKLENFKMVVCRARKKIVRRMNDLLGDDDPCVTTN
jgi:RNA polymerase sigma factor (sigma-70 family)